MSIHIEGLEGLEQRLEGMVSAANIEDAIKKATLLVEREARMKAPYPTIARSIASEIKATEGTVYTPLEYAPYVEYGTGKFSEHPQGGRKEVPWVYVEGSTKHSKSKKIYTEESARKMVAIMREAGLDAHYTYGQKPQPYMRPALDENRNEILRILGEGLIKID